MRLAVLAPILLLTALPLAAPGQVSAQETATSCGWELGKWVCRSIGPSGFGAFTDARQRSSDQGAIDRTFLEQMIRNRRAREEKARLDDQARQRQQLIAQVGALTDEHRCSDAISLAMKAGDLELAGLVPKICTPQD